MCWFGAQEPFPIINILNIFVETDAFFSDSFHKLWYIFRLFDEQKFQKNYLKKKTFVTFMSLLQFDPFILAVIAD